jgi:hypothetical protein
MNINVITSRIILACFVGPMLFALACEDSPKTTDGKPNLDWAGDASKEWVKDVKTEIRGVSCMYHSSYALCDLLYPSGATDQLKCYPGKNDETPRGCFRVEPVKASE